MFRRGNGTALDEVLHFLLEKVYGVDVLKRELRNCWPPADGRQRTEWKRMAKKFLESLASGGLLPQKLVSSAASLLQTASGTRLLELLCHLADHALRTVHTQMFPADNSVPAQLTHVLQKLTKNRQEIRTGREPSLPEPLLSPLIDASKSRTSDSEELFLRVCENSTSSHEAWKAVANSLTSTYRDLLAKNSALEQALDRLPEREQAPAFSEEAEQAAQLWEHLDRALDECSALAAASGPIMEGREHPHVIDASLLLGDSHGSSEAEAARQQGSRSLNVAAAVEGWAAQIQELNCELSSLERIGSSVVEPASQECQLGKLRQLLAQHSASKAALLELEDRLAKDVRESESSICQLQDEVEGLMKDQPTLHGACGPPQHGQGGLSPRDGTPLRLIPATPLHRGPAAESVTTPAPSSWADGSSGTRAPCLGPADAPLSVAGGWRGDQGRAKPSAIPPTGDAPASPRAADGGAGPAEGGVSWQASTPQRRDAAWTGCRPAARGLRESPPAAEGSGTATCEYQVPDTIERQFAEGLFGYSDRISLSGLSPSAEDASCSLLFSPDVGSSRLD
eukprot:CAMPEP_0177606362 /NCGR_PEP_ID=MMETSP0419_2-20121207/17264_1 /TAXON_ID=582737 /ORGANISM="Tetraselmis sp., Strain GSL018" /LENGTH=566 /DNA_ID=CAMNT_0019100713 /DNA_START=351 /DNA_END=2051 /DNA_ORIENTATION=-